MRTPKTLEEVIDNGFYDLEDIDERAPLARHLRDYLAQGIQAAMIKFPQSQNALNYLCDTWSIEGSRAKADPELTKVSASHFENLPDDTCDCSDCEDSGEPCQRDCEEDECGGCVAAREAAEDTRWAIDDAQGRR